MRIISTIIILAAVALFGTSAFAKNLSTDSSTLAINIKPFEKARPLFKADTVSITVMGDLMMHTMQIQKAYKADETYDFSSYFKHIQSYIAEADLAIGNMEFTLAGKPYAGYPCFSAPDSYAESIAKTGFDIFLCANNHIFDKGGAGAARTIQIYEALNKEYGILYTGLRTEPSEDQRINKLRDNNPLFVIRKGIRLAFVNFTYGTNVGSGESYPKVNRLTDKELLKNTINKASIADFVIALPHWGPEYILKHSPSQRKDAEFMVREGADIIVGSHPHVVQDYEIIDDVPVIYSVGNAVSNMSATNTQIELMVNFKLIRSNNGDIWMTEPELKWLWCSRPGGYCNDYTVIPIEDFIGRRDEWVGKWDYEKMVSSWMRVSETTGIDNRTKKNN